MTTPRSAGDASRDLTRFPHKQSSEFSDLAGLLARTYIGRVALVVDGILSIAPVAVALHEDRIVWHGSTGSGWLRHLRAGARVALEISTIDALVVGRATFENSFWYAGAVVRGVPEVLLGAERDAALRALNERIVPGRTSETRESSAQELAATIVLALALDDTVVKVSREWPDDAPKDVAGESWAGVVPIATTYGAPQATHDLRPEVPVPPSVRRLVANGDAPSGAGHQGVKVTVIGGQGAWPTPEAGCSGYLVEAAGQKILIDPGWATFQGLTRLVAPAEIDAVLVSHSHPDHCADLLPLLRARALSSPAADPLPVYGPAGALDRLLASDAVGAVQRAADLRAVADGSSVRIGAFDATFAELPHHVTNLGMRLSTGTATVSYTGDGGPDAAVAELAARADLHIAEATFPEPITGEDAGLLTDLATAVEQGASAGAHHVLLTHLWPGLSYDGLIADRFGGTAPAVSAAHPGFTWERPAESA